jgi:hypothetical protein
MIFRVASIARAHANLASRRYASSSVSTTTAKPLSPLNSFAQAWYNMYVQFSAQNVMQNSSLLLLDQHPLLDSSPCLIFYSLILSVSNLLIKGLVQVQRDMLPFWR